MRHSIVRRRFLMRHSIVPMLIDISLRHSSELKRYLNELPLCCLRLFRLFIISSNFLAVWNTRSDLKCSHFRLFAFLVTAKGIKTTRLEIQYKNNAHTKTRVYTFRRVLSIDSDLTTFPTRWIPFSIYNFLSIRKYAS